jgi:hypothetical protein
MEEAVNLPDAHIALRSKTGVPGGCRANRKLHQPNSKTIWRRMRIIRQERLEEIARLRRLLMAGPEIAPRLLPPEL